MFSLQISKIQKERADKEMSLISKHNEELKRTQLQAEDELREVYHLSSMLFHMIILAGEIKKMISYVSKNVMPCRKQKCLGLSMRLS